MDTMSIDPKDMANAVAAARDAVAGLEEPLKTEGFKIILERLIGAGAGAGAGAVEKKSDSKRGTAKGNGGSGAKAKKPAKERQALSTPSSLKLDVAGLKKLKIYCERFNLQEQGTEQVAFVLVNFARENTDLEFVTAGDVAYLHRQLISQRVKVPAVNDFADWPRALSWLTAPSRRKEWLEKSRGGYVVSNSGLLRWNEIEEEQAAMQKIQSP